MLGLGLSLVSIAVRQLLGFSPATLFGASDQGVWYDPSDYTTLFQDSAGTTPVTALEQPVGLMLDKSKGLVLGPELVVNGTFDTDVSGWTNVSLGAGAITWTLGGIRLVGTDSTNSGRTQQAVSVVVGRTYSISCTGAVASGSANFGIGPTSGAAPTTLAILVSQQNSGYFVATAATMYIIARTNSGGGDVTIDNISVRELPGNHASQPTATSRPVVSARVNLLTKTEQFDDAVWVKTNATITANAAVAPDGNMTADFLVEVASTPTLHQVRNTFQATSGTSLIFSLRAKGAGRRLALRIRANATTGNEALAVFDLTTQTVTLTSSIVWAAPVANITQDTNGWFKLSMQMTPLETSTIAADIGLANSSNQTVYPGDGTSGIYIWGADLRVANDGVGLPPYQRVNTATDYDSVGFPVYLRADGVDDGMVTNSIDFTATDKMTVVAGVRKLSDAAAAVVAELSANLNSNEGAFVVTAPFGIAPLYAYGVRSKGTTARDAFSPTSSPTAPATNILTGIGNISGDQAILRVNGTQAAIDTGDQGTGNFGNYPLYLFRRGGTTLPFNGRFYGMTIVNKLLSTAELAQLETYTNSKTKAFG